jgi:signal transduction histidine kinase
MAKSKQRLSDNFFTHIFSDSEGKKTISAYLRIILYVSIIVLPGLAVYKILYYSVLYPIDIILLALSLFFTFLLYLTKKGRIKAVSVLLILVTWIALTLMAAYSDGVKDIAIVAYIVIIFLATLLIGARFSLALTVISIISVWVMVFIPPKNGFMPAGDIPIMMSVDYTVLFIIVIASIIIFERSYQYSYDRINKELKDRIIAEEKLFKNEISLKEKNEELNRSNLQMLRINEELLKAKEKAEESDRLKTAFIQNISHEIRTPMNGIVGFLDLLQQPAAGSEKRKEYIEIINSCTMQLATLVNDLIDISKIETGAIDLHISEFEIDQLLNDVSVTYSKSAINKNLVLKVINDIGNVSIRTDYEKVKQILNNLVSNAIKFTQKGSILIKVSGNEGNLLISVTDSGIGISEPDKIIIFDRFRQAEVGLSRSFGGSGLGLTITKGYTEFLGGKIWVDSKPDVGSVFTVSIPVEFLSEKISAPKATPGIQIT